MTSSKLVAFVGNLYGQSIQTRRGAGMCFGCPSQREGWENLHTEFLRVFRRLEEVESREAGLQARVDALEGELEVARRALEPPARLRADSARVAQLQDEVVRLRAQCDSASAREHTALETLDGLRRHLVLVQQELHQAKGLKEDSQGMEHEKKSAKLQRERDILLIRLAALNERLAKAQDLQAELQRSASEKDLHLGKVQQQLAHEVERKQREMDARATLEAAYRALQSEVEARRNELNHVELQHKTAAIRAACLESTVAQLEEANDGLTKESADLAQRVAELKSLLRRRGLELDNAMASCQGVAGEMQHLEGSLAALEQKVGVAAAAAAARMSQR
ncbi:kinesin-like protein K39 [Frankliniella occidentalis]|uniref:Kinesin-like protein K39 n=1 Tax=Frankliniella occidentalis TaxID=133901 RepID=A0A9C6XS27_FRAOC|nr:kinesin-like protein K39 [Frankliniella occidentalis]